MKNTDPNDNNKNIPKSPSVPILTALSILVLTGIMIYYFNASTAATHTVLAADTTSSGMINQSGATSNTTYPDSNTDQPRATDSTSSGMMNQSGGTGTSPYSSPSTYAPPTDNLNGGTVIAPTQPITEPGTGFTNTPPAAPPAADNTTIPGADGTTDTTSSGMMNEPGANTGSTIFPENPSNMSGQSVTDTTSSGMINQSGETAN